MKDLKKLNWKISRRLFRIEKWFPYCMTTCHFMAYFCTHFHRFLILGQILILYFEKCLLILFENIWSTKLLQVGAMILTKLLPIHHWRNQLLKWRFKISQGPLRVILGHLRPYRVEGLGERFGFRSKIESKVSNDCEKRKCCFNCKRNLFLNGYYFVNFRYCNSSGYLWKSSRFF